MTSPKTRLIFQAAIDVFSQRGFEKATMDEIAARAEVAKGTIYYHYKSKEELFLFLVQEGTELLRESVLSKIDHEADAVTQLRTIIAEQLAFFREYRDFCIIMLREAWGADSRQREFRRMLVHYVNAIQEVVELGVVQHTFSTTDPLSSSWSIFGSISITALHHMFRDADYDLRLLTPELEQMVLHGLLPATESATR